MQLVTDIEKVSLISNATIQLDSCIYLLAKNYCCAQVLISVNKAALSMVWVSSTVCNAHRYKMLTSTGSDGWTPKYYMNSALNLRG